MAAKMNSPKWVLLHRVSTSMFSFNQRKRRQQVTRVLRRIADVTSPNLRSIDDEGRAVDRVNRSLPVLIAPWEKGRPDATRCVTAMSKDFSDRGVGVVTQHPLGCEDVVVGLLAPPREGEPNRRQPQFAVGKIRQFLPMGGGFWQIGIELTRLVDPDHSKQFQSLEAMAAKLVPNETPVEVE